MRTRRSSDRHDSLKAIKAAENFGDKEALKLKEDELMAHIENMAAIGQLAAGVAHELNTPLGTISIISNELDRAIEGCGAKNLPAELIHEYLVDMRSEIARCKTIIQDLLDFSKSGVSHVVEADINAIVSKTVDFILKGNAGSDVAITKLLDAKLPAIMTDPDRFRQVLFNVIKNAVEAVEDNGGGKVEISTASDPFFVRVVVEDDGPGIEEEHLKRVFEPFFTTKAVGKGTGLGLSVSYGIMRALRGEIRFESKPGKGTKMILLLPITF